MWHLKGCFKILRFLLFVVFELLQFVIQKLVDCHRSETNLFTIICIYFLYMYTERYKYFTSCCCYCCFLCQHLEFPFPMFCLVYSSWLLCFTAAGWMDGWMNELQKRVTGLYLLFLWLLFLCVFFFYFIYIIIYVIIPALFLSHIILPMCGGSHQRVM